MGICELGRTAAVVLWPEQRWIPTSHFYIPVSVLERNRGIILWDKDVEGDTQRILVVHFF